MTDLIVKNFAASYMKMVYWPRGLYYYHVKIEAVSFGLTQILSIGARRGIYDSSVKNKNNY
jgi:hypothetical protein